MHSQFKAASDDAYTRILFVRHGRTSSNTSGKIASYTDEPLDFEGIKQIEIASQIIHTNYPPAVILCSPMPRAIQSAEIIAKDTNLIPVPMVDLLEFNFGIVAGLTLAQIEQRYPELYRSFTEWVESENQQAIPHPVFPQGESMPMVAERVTRLTKHILDYYRGKIIVAVSHGGFIKCCLQVYTGGMFDRSIPFWIDNASISVVDFYKNTAIIRLVNDISYLHEKLTFSHPTII
jgi:broad specificity phosphatase PhoE